MQDGQNLFDPGLSFIRGQDWRLDETAQWLIEAGAIEPLIIVGVDHAGVGRAGEFAPTRGSALRRGRARRAVRRRCSSSELKPWIDAHYRTRPDAASTGIGGSSMGGLVSLFLALTRADVFGRVAVMSPSLWWDRRHIIALATRARAQAAVRIWLDCRHRGGLHDAAERAHPEEHAAAPRLAHGRRPALSSKCRAARHSEQDWGARAGEMLQIPVPAGQ